MRLLYIRVSTGWAQDLGSPRTRDPRRFERRPWDPRVLGIPVRSSAGPGISIFTNNEAIPREEKDAEKEAERKR